MFPKDFVELLNHTTKTYQKRVESAGIQIAPSDYLDGLNSELTRACTAAGYTPQQIEGFTPAQVTRAAGAGAGGGEATGERHDWPAGKTQ